ncbi:hypothetical protein EJD97_014311 [Solanum chilense]|uniref:Uncharacterized protein n=1 Tax=Solanum chilense TaxID=4083 RepID=A0A6N2B9Z1_SOLCI|nr:hypothetical protein EJD97_014311 [Solanum chilense]
MLNISSPLQSFQMEPPSNQIYYGYKCSPHLPEVAKMAGVKRRYPFSPGSPPIPSFRCKKCCVAPISRPNKFTSYGNKCSINVEEGNVLKREVISKSKALNGDFLILAPTSTTLPHFGEVAAVEHTRHSGLSISLQQPILGFIQSTKVQVDLERTRRSGFHSEVEGNVDLELKLEKFVNAMSL